MVQTRKRKHHRDEPSDEEVVEKEETVANVSRTPRTSRRRRNVATSSSTQQIEEDSQPKRKRRRRSNEEPTSSATSDNINNSEAIQTPSEKQECSVCYEDIQEQGVIDSCNHSFCVDCISKWSEESNTCPVCKQRFNSIRKKSLVTGRLSDIQQVPQRDFRLHNDATLIPVLWLLQDLIEGDSDDEERRRGNHLGLLIERLFTVRFALRLVQREIPTPTTPINGNTIDDPVVISDDEL
jgi:hypothetical protein